MSGNTHLVSCLSDKFLVLSSCCHDGQNFRFHARYRRQIVHSVCGVTVCIEDAQMPWKDLGSIACHIGRSTESGRVAKVHDEQNCQIQKVQSTSYGKIPSRRT